MRGRSWSIAGALTIVAAGGCTPANSGVFVEGLKVPGMTCEYQVDAVYLAAAVLDTDSRSLAVRPLGIRYYAIAQVSNQMLDLGNITYPLMADPNQWIANEAEVEIRDVGGGVIDFGGLPNPFRVPAMGYVPSAEDPDTPGRALVSFEAIPAVYGEAFLDQTTTIVLGIRIRGTTVGGSTQTTGEFTLPVTLCDGCLFACQMDAMGMPAVALSCLPGQDQVSFLCL
jgi:hypothetical protein